MSGSAYALAVLFAINLMNFFDRQIIGGVGEGIRREWALSDTALGLLGTVFTLLYAVVGLPLGRLSDRSMRSRILAGGVFVWSLLTAASGIARNFSQLIVARRREGNPYLLVLSIPTLLWIIVSGALHNFNMYALGAFVSPFIIRFHKMSPLTAGWVAAAVYGFSGIVGLTLGGALADRLY